jgi:hypothetical protein
MGGGAGIARGGGGGKPIPTLTLTSALTPFGRAMPIRSIIPTTDNATKLPFFIRNLLCYVCKVRLFFVKDYSPFLKYNH